jgi:hypothetical protein
MQLDSPVFKAMRNTGWVTVLMVVITLASAAVHFFAGHNPGWVDFFLKKVIATVGYAWVVFLFSWVFFTLRKKR